MIRKVLTALLAALLILTSLCACHAKPESEVGIIGGADGPTTIFIAGTTP